MVTRSIGYLVLAIMLMVMISACEETVVEQASPTVQAALPMPSKEADRILGLDLSLPDDGDFDRAFNMAYELGVREFSLSLGWDDLETSPGEFSPAPNWLAIANQYYGKVEGVVLSLMIGPIDTNIDRMPSDLKGRDFDDPQVIHRFQVLLDYVFTQIPDLELSSLSIGNEIDAFLGASADRWGQYQTFYQAAVEYARGLRPGLLVGAKAQYSGLLGDAQTYLQALNAASDVILVTYYPLNDDFTVREPGTVSEDFNVLTTAYDNRVIHILEAGYPTSEVLNSSEAKQAQFIRAVFEAWDTHASQIRVVSFTWLTDLSTNAVRDLEDYYGFSARNFAEFLRTLGLRTYEGGGVDKQGFQVLLEEAGRRGW